MSNKQAVVLGAGNFGTALAQHLARKGFNTTIWARDPAIADAINRTHRNPRYQSEFTLESNLSATCQFTTELFEASKIIVLAIPTQHLRSVLKQASAYIDKNHILVCASKGIEISTLKMPITIVAEECPQIPKEKVAVLSGPSFAVEVIERQPTAVSVASISTETAHTVQEFFHTGYFRAYSSPDPIGLEVAGALKNVIALAAGAAIGMGLANNAQAALLTRGLAEITRIGLALGAAPITFNGLGGVGDLFLTCTSQKSRNYRVGFEVGQGKPLNEVIAGLGSVAEGVTTAKSAYNLSIKLNVDAPITKVVYQVIYDGVPVREALASLLDRAMKPEVTYP